MNVLPDLHVLDRAREYLAGALPQDDALDAYRHLLGCSACREGLEVATSLRRAGGHPIEGLIPPADELGRRRELAFLHASEPITSSTVSNIPAWMGSMAAAACLLLVLQPWNASDLASLPAHADLESLPVRTSRALPAPESAEALRLAGLEAYRAGDMMAAVVELRLAAGLDPNSAETLLYLGSAHALIGERTSARSAFVATTELVGADQPYGAEARWQLVQLALLAGDRGLALRWLDDLGESPARRAIEASELRATLR